MDVDLVVTAIAMIPIVMSMTHQTSIIVEMRRKINASSV